MHNAPANSFEYEAEQPAFEILALAYDDVNVGCAVWVTREVVRVAGCASPHVGVGRLEDDPVQIGPVEVSAFPDAARYEGLTLRKLARRMLCSPMPLYTCLLLSIWKALKKWPNDMKA